MKKILLYLVPIIVLGVFALVFIITMHHLGQVNKFAKKIRPHSVATETVQYKNWKPRIKTTGNIVAFSSVEVTTQSGGLVTARYFESGQMVKQGDLLLQLDDTKEQASLKQNQSLLFSKQLTYERYKTLVKQGAVSVSDFDDAEAQYLSQKALVANDLAQIKLLKVIAPFDGQLGISNLSLGEYVNAGYQVCKLVDLSKMYVDFSVSQKDISSLRLGEEVELELDAYPDKKFVGKITTISPAVADNSGMVNVQAVADNSSGLLRSGMYVTVHVVLPTLTQQIVIPQTAVEFNTYGSSVYVIDKSRKPVDGYYHVKSEIIKVSARYQGMVLVSKGLNVGDKIITLGLYGLSGDALVVERKETLPRNIKNLPDL